MESLTLNVRVAANDKKSFEQFCNIEKIVLLPKK